MPSIAPVFLFGQTAAERGKVSEYLADGHMRFDFLELVVQRRFYSVLESNAQQNYSMSCLRNSVFLSLDDESARVDILDILARAEGGIGDQRADQIARTRSGSI
ncbi:hypothetical protein FQZ97_849070 [compost metagenome]